MKLFLKISILIGVLLITGIVGINFYINQSTKEIIFDANEVQPKTTGLILGAYVYQDGRMSDMFRDRVDTAIELYQANKISKILVSGDHGRQEYDEVNAAKDYLLENNIPAKDIFTDHAGFDTYDSLYRARDVFEVKDVIVITQEFHLPRALYIGKSLDLEITGVKADQRAYRNISYNYRREIPAKIKAFLNVIFHSKPKFLGGKIPITGDGQKSWD